MDVPFLETSHRERHKSFLCTSDRQVWHGPRRNVTPLEIRIFLRSAGTRTEGLSVSQSSGGVWNPVGLGGRRPEWEPCLALLFKNQWTPSSMLKTHSG